jgi:hypothetical protein
MAYLGRSACSNALSCRRSDLGTPVILDTIYHRSEVRKALWPSLQLWSRSIVLSPCEMPQSDEIERFSDWFDLETTPRGSRHTYILAKPIFTLPLCGSCTGRFNPSDIFGILNIDLLSSTEHWTVADNTQVRYWTLTLAQRFHRNHDISYTQACRNRDIAIAGM